MSSSAFVGARFGIGSPFGRSCSYCTKLFVPTPGGFRRFPVGGGEWVSRERDRSPERSLCSPRPVYPCASVRLGAQVLFPIHLHEFEEVAERQRPDQQSQDPEIRYAGERTDEGDEGVNVRPAPEHHRSQDVVDIPDEEADQCDERGGARTVADEQRDGRRHPDESAADDRQDTERSEEHTSELQSPCNLVCRLLLEKKKQT